MRSVIAVVSLSVCLVSTQRLNGQQNQGFKPTMTPVLASDGAGFLLDAQNSYSVDLTVHATGGCDARIDSRESREYQWERTYSGGGTTVVPGGKWKELIRLVTTTRTSETRQRPSNPLFGQIEAYREIVVALSTGRHVAAFNCGGGWTADFEFFWLGNHNK